VPEGVLDATPVPGLGLVGDPLPSAPSIVVDALELGLIPVVAPLAQDSLGGPLNVNGDEAAAALAVGLGADRIIFVTDVPGVLVAGGVAHAIGADEAERLVGAGEFEGGIVPKLLAAARAARGGVPAEIGVTAVTA
jgi:acetylglutamate kinase